MTGEGPTLRERKRERVTCGDCGKELAAGLLDSHQMTQQGKARGKRWTWTDAATQLIGLFDRVGLNTNTGKTVSMNCQPCTEP